MAISAQNIIFRAQTLLQDTDGVRWPAPELVGYLNDAQRELSRLRPDQTAAVTSLTLSAGYKQQLPSQYHTLIDITSNVGGRRSRITKVDMALLDATVPDWRSSTPSNTIKHFMHDLTDPDTFYVYPPAAASTQVEVVVSEYPADIPIPTAPAYTGVTGFVSLPDIWGDALLNYVMHRAYMKDAEYGGNAQLSASYYALFNTAVGSQLQSASAVTKQGA